MRRTIAATWLTLALASTALGQGIPDTIVVDGVPEVPGDLATLLKKYQEGRSAGFQDWAGGRREILFLTRAADTNQVFAAATPGGDKKPVTTLKDRVGSAANRPGSDEVLVTTDEGGAENYQILVVDPAKGTSRRLTDGKSRNLGPRWSRSGKLLAWSGNSRNGKDMDLHVMDPDRPGSDRIVKPVAGSWSVADWSPDDGRLAAVEAVSANESYVHVVELATGQSVAVTPRPEAGGPTVSRGDVRFSKDGGSIFWTSDAADEFLRLARHDLATGADAILTGQIPWDVEGYDLADDGRTIALTANEDGISRLHVLDAATGREQPAPRLPVGQVGSPKFRPGTRECAFSLSSARTPADVYSVDLDSGVLVRWTTSDTGGVDPSRFAEPELIRYKSFDGRTIPAFVYRPTRPANRPRPVVIDIHGGPEGQFRPGYLGRANALIEELGIVVIHPNVRGSTGYGKTYLKLDNGRLREDSVKDIGALLDWIDRQPDLDKSRVAVQGGSYGGYMCLATMTHYNDRLKAGIDVVGICNFVGFLKNTSEYRRDLRRVEYGDERDPAMASFLEQISPLTSADRITRPMLVVHGRNDPRVPVTESEQIVAKVRKGGGPVWYVVAKNEGHGFAKKPNQDFQQAVQVAFLRQYLVGP